MEDCKLCCRMLNRNLPIRPLLVLFLGTFLIALPLICYNLQYSSYFFPGNLNYANYLARGRDEKRMARAESNFALMEKKHQLPYVYGRGYSKDRPESSAPTLSIVITAVNRNTHETDAFEPHYLTQTLHTLLHAINADLKTFGMRWRRVNVSICNVDTFPNTFGEAERLSKVVRVFQRRHPLKMDNPLCKEKEDFAFCLSRVVSIDENEYIVVLEDDMLSQVDSMEALYDLLQTRLPRRFGKKGVRNRLGSVQLYTPLRDYQYLFTDSTTWLELMLLTGFGTFVLFFFYFRLHCRPYNMVANIMLLVVLSFYTIMVLLLVGRPHVLNARHAITRQYSLSDAPGPNFSAVLFPANLAEELASYVQGTECSSAFSKPKAVDRFMQVKQRRSLAFYPSLFHHIGLYSVYRKDTIYPYDLDA